MTPAETEAAIEETDRAEMAGEEARLGPEAARAAGGGGVTLNPSPCRDAPRLVAGTLSPEERRDFEEHCRHCAGCRLKVAKLLTEDMEREASERARRGGK